MNNLDNIPTTLDDFNIEKVIGKGSFGSVYLVRRKVDNKNYALKTVFLEKLNKKEQENSVNEVRLLASISHPNVIGYKEAFLDENTSTLNIIMEYADGGDLQAKINKKRKQHKYFNENIVWLYSIQMIEGLKALHDKKIMHRDLKSANVFLTKNNIQCKLGDMNVSKVIKEKVLTTQTGTPYYASPEVWRDEPYSYKSDLWSIGCVIYEMCELKPPFNGKDLDELFENVCKGNIKRISCYYSEELWNMILMLLQHDVEKRVDCDEFLNSKIIQNKIKEFKNNPNTYIEGYQLEKNRNINIKDDILFGTINFKNLNELKNKLPNIKNYEDKNINNKIYINISNDNKNNNNNNYKFKNDSITALLTNSSINSNINQYLSINNIQYNNNSSSNNEKKSKKKKKLKLDYINLKINKNFFIKEKQNIINIKNNIKQKDNKQKSKTKDTKNKLPKNISFNGINHSSYINKIRNENRNIDINSSERNLFLSKNKSNFRFEKKKNKEFEKIIEYNKIKELLKISKKKVNNTNRPDKIKNYNKKSCGNLFRNQTENNNKILNRIMNNNIFKKIQKSIFSNSNKSNLITRINTEQKISLVNKIYNQKLGMYFKKILKSPTSISIINNKNKERAHSQGINRGSIETKNNNNNKKLLIKKRIKNIYFNLFNLNSIKMKNSNNKKPKLLQCTPFSKNNKSSKRNLTTIPNNNQSNNYVKSIKDNKSENRLLNEIFNTVNFNLLDNNIVRNSVNNKYNSYFNLSKYYHEIEKTFIPNKTKKIICHSHRQYRKPMICISNKNKKCINILKEVINDNISNNNILINKSCANNNKLNNLFNYNNFSNIINKKNKITNNNKSNDNVNINGSFINLYNKKNKPKINYPLSLREKSLPSSIKDSNSNVDIIKKKNSFIYNIKKKMRKKKKIKNISIKKLNVPPLSNPNKNNNNNFIRYNNYFKKINNRHLMEFEPLITIREKTFRENNNNKKILNISALNNYISFNHNTFLHNRKPIYLNIKGNKLKKIEQKTNINRNKRMNTVNSEYTIKNNKLIKSQIFNNYYSINNIDASNLPVRVINFYN